MQALSVRIGVLVAVAVCAACSSGGGGTGDGTGPGPGPGVGTPVPTALVGGWYAGSGHTSAAYDSTTGTWGTPNGDGLVYLFEPNGSYTKAFQSYYGTAGCTTGFTAFESGVLYIDGAVLDTKPSQGHMEFRDTCAPSANADKPLTELEVESFTWQLGPSEYDPSLTVLHLERADGAAATFIPL